MHHLIQLGRAKGKIPVCLAHSEQACLGIISGGESHLHHCHQLLIAVAQESEKNRLFVLKVFVDGGLAILNALGYFTGRDSLPPFLSGNLSRSGENALPDLLSFAFSRLPFSFSTLLDSHCTCNPVVDRSLYRLSVA